MEAQTGSDRQEGGRMEGWGDGGRAGRRAGGDVRAPCASSPRSARNRSPPRSAPGRASASPAPSAGPPREMRGSVSRTEPTERRAAPRPACKGLRAERWRLCALRACDRGSAAFELAPAGPTGARKAWAPRRIPGGSDRECGACRRRYWRIEEGRATADHSKQAARAARARTSRIDGAPVRSSQAAGDRKAQPATYIET